MTTSVLIKDDDITSNGLKIYRKLYQYCQLRTPESSYLMDPIIGISRKKITKVTKVTNHLIGRFTKLSNNERPDDEEDRDEITMWFDVPYVGSTGEDVAPRWNDKFCIIFIVFGPKYPDMKYKFASWADGEFNFQNR